MAASRRAAVLDIVEKTPERTRKNADHALCLKLTIIIIYLVPKSI